MSPRAQVEAVSRFLVLVLRLRFERCRARFRKGAVLGWLSFRESRASGVWMTSQTKR